MTAGSIAVPTIIPLRPPVPGRPKHIIDSDTRIELKSESGNVDLYYTIDGSKPEPFAPLGTDRSTFRYRGAFTLPGGKQTVKALATSRDGVRQSNINTKVFEVEYLEKKVEIIPEDDERSFQKELMKERSRKISRPYRQAWNEDRMNEIEAYMTDMSVHGKTSLPAYSSARFTGARASQSQHQRRQLDSSYAGERAEDEGMQTSTHRVPNASRQMLKLQRQTDFLRCVHCNTQRPSDPFARFCPTCGNVVPPLPGGRPTVPDPAEMGMCHYCKSVVPLNTEACVVCGASMPEQGQPQMSLKLTKSKICQKCGTGNPANIKYCLLCESVLPEESKPVQPAKEAPANTSVPRGRRVKCSQCHRVNDSEARFCDWCGVKPRSSDALECSRCGASTSLYSAYCSSCGEFLNQSTASNARWSPIPDDDDPNKSQLLYSLASQSLLNPKRNKPKTSTISTQTVGLYYPSEREMKRRQQEEEEKLALEREMRNRKPLLTSISPGRGYWRKQLEHVTIHLKAEAQNNPEFRALIGEHRMGKLTSVAVHEDGFELTLTASFSMKDQRDPFQPSPLTGSRVLSDLTQRRRHMDSESSEESDAVDDDKDSYIMSEKPEPKGKKAKKKSHKRKTEDTVKLSPEERKLLKEVGKNGEGRADEVLQLMTEGASPLVCTSKGVPALTLAVSNKHLDCVQALLDNEADVNMADKDGNTALHEAVNLGYEGKEFMDMLLSYGADIRAKNAKGQTPHDLAVRTGNNTASKLLMTNLGQSNLDKITRPSRSAGKSGKHNLF